MRRAWQRIREHNLGHVAQASDTDHLVDIACGEFDSEVRLSAVARVSREQDLVQMAAWSSSTEVQLASVHRIEYLADLDINLEDDGQWHDRFRPTPVIWRMAELNADEALARVAREAKGSYECHAAVSAL